MNFQSKLLMPAWAFSVSHHMYPCCSENPGRSPPAKSNAKQAQYSILGLFFQLENRRRCLNNPTHLKSCEEVWFNLWYHSFAMVFTKPKLPVIWSSECFSGGNEVTNSLRLSNIKNMKTMIFKFKHSLLWHYTFLECNRLSIMTQYEWWFYILHHMTA